MISKIMTFLSLPHSALIIFMVISIQTMISCSDSNNNNTEGTSESAVTREAQREMEESIGRAHIPKWSTPITDSINNLMYNSPKELTQHAIKIDREQFHNLLVCYIKECGQNYITHWLTQYREKDDYETNPEYERRLDSTLRVMEKYGDLDVFEKWANRIITVIDIPKNLKYSPDSETAVLFSSLSKYRTRCSDEKGSILSNKRTTQHSNILFACEPLLTHKFNHESMKQYYELRSMMISVPISRGIARALDILNSPGVFEHTFRFTKHRAKTTIDGKYANVPAIQLISARWIVGEDTLWTHDEVGEYPMPAYFRMPGSPRVVGKSGTVDIGYAFFTFNVQNGLSECLSVTKSIFGDN